MRLGNIDNRKPIFYAVGNSSDHIDLIFRESYFLWLFSQGNEVEHAKIKQYIPPHVT